MRFIWSDGAESDLARLGLEGARKGIDGALAASADPFDPATNTMITDADGYDLYCIAVPIEQSSPVAPSFDPGEDELWSPPSVVAVVYQTLTHEDRALNRYRSADLPAASGVVRAVLQPPTGAAGGASAPAA